MTFPVLVPGLNRNTNPVPGEVEHKKWRTALVLSSCDPHLGLISCGNGCCDKDASMCIEGFCLPRQNLPLPIKHEFCINKTTFPPFEFCYNTRT
jgi:hypothetical protein